MLIGYLMVGSGFRCYWLFSRITLGVMGFEGAAHQSPVDYVVILPHFHNQKSISDSLLLREIAIKTYAINTTAKHISAEPHIRFDFLVIPTPSMIEIAE